MKRWKRSIWTGVEALAARPHRGRRPLLSVEQENELARIVREGRQAAGFVTGRSANGRWRCFSSLRSRPDASSAPAERDPEPPQSATSDGVRHRGRETTSERPATPGRQVACVRERRGGGREAARDDTTACPFTESRPQSGSAASPRPWPSKAGRRVATRRGSSADSRGPSSLQGWQLRQPLSRNRNPRFPPRFQRLRGAS